MVVPPHGRPSGPGMLSRFSRLAIARGLEPSANSRKIRPTILASKALMRRSPVLGATTLYPYAFPPGGLPLQRFAKLAAPGLLTQIGQIELGHGAEEANMHRTDLADVNGIKADAAKAHRSWRSAISESLRPSRSRASTTTMSKMLRSRSES